MGMVGEEDAKRERWIVKWSEAWNGKLYLIDYGGREVDGDLIGERERGTESERDVEKSNGQNSEEECVGLGKKTQYLKKEQREFMYHHIHKSCIDQKNVPQVLSKKMCHN